MIEKSLLDKAKAYLCWDCFSGLVIQLIPMTFPVSYYYPPSKKHTILIFFDPNERDFSKPLFSLFHEAGHYEQFIEMKNMGNANSFWEKIDETSGPEREAFERDGWERGRVLLKQFLEKYKLDTKWIEYYMKLADDKIKSYSSYSSTSNR